jgi:hypothetical protein
MIMTDDPRRDLWGIVSNHSATHVSGVSGKRAREAKQLLFELLRETAQEDDWYPRTIKESLKETQKEIESWPDWKQKFFKVGKYSLREE